jgi:leucine-rich repeat-containing protein 49
VHIESVVETVNLSLVNKFTKLKEIVLKDNFIVSLLQLANLEALENLKMLAIERNPINKCTFLREFVVY